MPHKTNAVYNGQEKTICLIYTNRLTRAVGCIKSHMIIRKNMPNSCISAQKSVTLQQISK